MEARKKNEEGQGPVLHQCYYGTPNNTTRTRSSLQGSPETPSGRRPFPHGPPPGCHGTHWGPHRGRESPRGQRARERLRGHQAAEASLVLKPSSDRQLHSLNARTLLPKELKQQEEQQSTLSRGCGFCTPASVAAHLLPQPIPSCSLS